MINIKPCLGLGVISLPAADIATVSDQTLSSEVDEIKTEIIDNPVTVQEEVSVAADSEKPIVLIVEDIPVMRVNIKSVLETKYRIIEAGNGKEALRFASEAIPDLIVSDWMMPEMNGIEFCRYIKADEKTSHVPIIMLTSRSETKDKIEGFDTGADDYVTKPFEPEVLLARVRNLISNRKKLQQKFYSAWLSDKKEEKLDPIDDKFIRKAEEIIEKNLSTDAFDVSVMCAQIGMSQPQLYRKLMALTGLSPTLFIRNYRLKRAAQFLTESNNNVSEVMYRVGYNSRSYFIKCFREVFGVLPSEYKK